MDATPLSPAERERILTAIRNLTRLMDSAFELPGTKYRVGLDPILGLIPGGGDAVSMLVSVWMIVLARRLGLKKRHLLRMVGNVGLDALIGAIPLLGDLFDFAFKANQRNLAILERHHQRQTSLP